MGVEFIRALGVRIIEVQDYDGAATYLKNERLLLLDAAMGDAERERISDDVLRHVS